MSSVNGICDLMVRAWCYFVDIRWLENRDCGLACRFCLETRRSEQLGTLFLKSNGDGQWILALSPHGRGQARISRDHEDRITNPIAFRQIRCSTLCQTLYRQRKLYGDHKTIDAHEKAPMREIYVVSTVYSEIPKRPRDVQVHLFTCCRARQADILRWPARNLSSSVRSMMMCKPHMVQVHWWFVVAVPSSRSAHAFMLTKSKVYTHLSDERRWWWSCTSRLCHHCLAIPSKLQNTIYGK